MVDGDIVHAVQNNGQTLQQIKTPYSTAVSVQIPRDLETVRRRIKDEALIGGEMMYYAWGAGKNHIEGPSIHLAMTAARCWGNCAVFSEPVQETADAWIFGSSFVDLETGFTLTRQFRQGKNTEIYGKHSEERKADMRFQIGQSKASRNVVLNAIPKSILNEAMEIAKSGVRTKLENWISKQGEGGMAKAQDTAMAALLKLGIKEDRVLAKLGRPAVKALILDDLIILKGDIVALQEGSDRAEELYPEVVEKDQNGVMDHLGGEPEPDKPKPKARKRKTKAEMEKDTPTPPPEEKNTGEGESDAQSTTQAEPMEVKTIPPYFWGDSSGDSFTDFLADCNGGEYGPNVQEAVMELKSRKNRLSEDDPLALSKYKPDWVNIEAQKEQHPDAGAIISDLIRWYFNDADAAGFPQE